MKALKSKVACILLCVSILAGATIYAIQQFIIYPSFVDLEHIEAEKDLDRCVGAIKREIYHLDSGCNDWASWDDTYAFIESSSNEYIESNLVLSTFTNNGLNLIYFINTKGEVIWGNIYDLETQEKLKLTDLILVLFRQLISKTKKGSHTELRVSGVLTTEHGPLLIACRPVLTSNNEGPVKGFVIMGRFLTANVLKTLIEQTQVSFEVLPIINQQPPETVSDILNSITPESPSLIEKKGNDHLMIHNIFRDINGNACFLIRAKIPRDITRKGYATIGYAMISNLLSMLAILTVILFLLKRAILRPITDLTGHAVSVGKTGDLSARLSLQRPDEIGMLAGEFDRMLARLEARSIEVANKKEQLELEISERRHTEDALLRSEKKYRLLADNVIDSIWTMDIDSLKITFCSPSIKRLLGYTDDEILGQNPMDMLTMESKEMVLKVLEEELSREGTHGVDPNRSRLIEIEQIHMNGSSVWAEVIATFLRDENGKITELLGVTREISERKQAEEERERLINELQTSLSEIRQLSGLLPICSSCKNIRDDNGYWNQIELYIRDHSEAEFSHGICPECAEELYPDL